MSWTLALELNLTTTVEFVGPLMAVQHCVFLLGGGWGWGRRGSICCDGPHSRKKNKQTIKSTVDCDGDGGLCWITKVLKQTVAAVKQSAADNRSRLLNLLSHKPPPHPLPLHQFATVLAPPRLRVVGSYVNTATTLPKAPRLVSAQQSAPGTINDSVAASESMSASIVTS